VLYEKSGYVSHCGGVAFFYWSKIWEGSELWDSIWNFAVDHHIFHTLIVVGLLFLIFGPKKYKKVVLGKQGLELHGSDENCGEIQHKHEMQLNKIEKLLEEDLQDRETRQIEVNKKFDELDTGFNELKNVIEANDILTGKTSEGTLTAHLFIDGIWPFLKMKSFRRLLAMKKNGRIWEKGFALISGSKEYQIAWLDVQETELDIEIVDEEYYYGRLREIENRITHDFSKRTV
jgi:hypothetical protein